MITDVIAEQLKKFSLEPDNFQAWTPKRITDFQKLEKEAFREELHYSKQEIYQLGQKPMFEGLLIYQESEIVGAFLLHQADTSGSLVLNTIIILPKIKGMGTRILSTLIEQAAQFGWQELHLDTEFINEKGKALVAFYQRFGMKIETISNDGNVHMSILLKQHHNDTNLND